MADQNLRPNTFIDFNYSASGDLTIRLQSRITVEQLNDNAIPIQFETTFLEGLLRLQITITHNRQTDKIEAYLQVEDSPCSSLAFTIKYWIWPLQNEQESRLQEFTYLCGVEERSAINPFCRASLIVQYLAANKGQRKPRFSAFYSEIVVTAERVPITELQQFQVAMYNGKRCDHVILIGTQQIGAHRRHLVYSGFFRRRFARIPDETLTMVSNIELDILYDLLRFMYGIVIHPDRLRSNKLLRAAREFEMGILINICEAARNMQTQGAATGSSSITKVEKATTAAKKMVAKIRSDTIKTYTDLVKPIVQNPIDYIRDRVAIPNFLSGLHGDLTTNPQPSSANTADFDGDLKPIQRKRSSPVQRRRPSIKPLSMSTSASSNVQSLDGSPPPSAFSRKGMVDKLLTDASNVRSRNIASSRSGSSNQLSISRLYPGNRERMATESTLSTESVKDTRSYASDSVMCATVATAEASTGHDNTTDESSEMGHLPPKRVMNRAFAVAGMFQWRDAEGNSPNLQQISYADSMVNVGSQSLNNVASITEETSIDKLSRGGSLSDISSISEDNGNLSPQSSLSSPQLTAPSSEHGLWDGEGNRLDSVKESIKSSEELSSANDFCSGEQEPCIYIREPMWPVEKSKDNLLRELEQTDDLIAEEIQFKSYLEQFDLSESYSPSNSTCDLSYGERDQLSLIREEPEEEKTPPVEQLSEEERQKMDALLAEDLQLENYLKWFEPLPSYDFWYGERERLGFIREPDIYQELSESEQQHMDAQIVEELKLLNEMERFHLPRPSSSRNVQQELPLGGGVKRKDPNRLTRPNKSTLDSESDDAVMGRNVQPIVTQRNGSVPIDDFQMPNLISLSTIESVGAPPLSSSPTKSHSESVDAEKSHNGHHIATQSRGSKPVDDHPMEVIPSDTVGQPPTDRSAKESVGTAFTRQSTKSTSSSSITLHSPTMSHDGQHIATQSNGSKQFDPMDTQSDTFGQTSTGLSSIESIGTEDSLRQSTESPTLSSSSTKPKETKDNTKGSDDSDE